MFYTHFIDAFSLRMTLKESKHVGGFKVLIVKLNTAILGTVLVIV
jgi:hypothetical protein